MDGTTTRPERITVTRGVRSGQMIIVSVDSTAVLGLGHFGALVAGRLAARGVRLVVADVDESRRALADSWGASWLAPEQALLAPVDVLVPCAVGGIVSAVGRERDGATIDGARLRVLDIGRRLADLLAASARSGEPPLRAAKRELGRLLTPES